MKGYDYTLAGGYFVTLVIWGHTCVFGEIIDGNMHLNHYGTLVENEWRRLEKRFPQVVVDEWIVIPNHLHGILMIVEVESIDTVGARQRDSILSGVGVRQENSNQSGGSSFASPLQPGSLGAIVGAYKSTTARLINGLRRTPGAPVWQRNYYEHIIRNERDLDEIRAYVRNNPLQWELDHENPAQFPSPE